MESRINKTIREKIWDKGSLGDSLSCSGLLAVEKIQDEVKCSFNDAFFLYMIRLGLLSVDGSGRVWRKGTIKYGKYYHYKSRVRAEIVDDRYMHVNIQMEGAQRHIAAIRLVYLYYNGRVPDGMSVQNKNGLRNDNRPENLTLIAIWDAKRYNMVNMLIPEVFEKLDSIIRPKVENTPPDEVCAFSSNTRAVRKALPMMNKMRVGLALSLYFDKYSDQWTIERSRGACVKKYLVSRKPQNVVAGQTGGMVSCS
jgi:hypothetical protein